MEQEFNSFELDKNFSDLEDPACECCGGSGCPACNSCGGNYSPGSEECDFCEWSEECLKDANESRRKKKL